MRYYRSSALGATPKYQWIENTEGRWGQPKDAVLCYSYATQTPVSPGEAYCGKKPSGPITTGLTTALSWLRTDLQTQGALRAGQPAPSGGTPKWLLPVGIGLTAVGVVLIATKKKQS